MVVRRINLKINEKLVLSCIALNPKVDTGLLASLFEVSEVHIVNLIIQLIEQNYIYYKEDGYYVKDNVPIIKGFEDILFYEEDKKEEFDWRIDYIPDKFKIE